MHCCSERLVVAIKGSISDTSSSCTSLLTFIITDFIVTRH